MVELVLSNLMVINTAGWETVLLTSGKKANVKFWFYQFLLQLPGELNVELAWKLHGCNDNLHYHKMWLPRKLISCLG